MKRKSIKGQVIDRLNEITEYGISRFELKRAARADGEKIWTFTDGKIHSQKTRRTYQQQVFNFLDFARSKGNFRTLEELTGASGDLTVAWLRERLDRGDSAWTLQLRRTALRMFFGNRELGAEVKLPLRRHTDIKRTRRPQIDSHINLDNYTNLINLCRATGLRRHELAKARVKDIFYDDGHTFINVVGKGGRPRVVPVLLGRDKVIAEAIEGKASEDRLVDNIPRRLRVHQYRREYCRAYYAVLSGRELPPPRISLRGMRNAYDKEALLRVSEALGHSRVSVILSSYR